MPTSRLCLLAFPLLAIASLPVVARAQLNSPEIRVNPNTGEEMRGSEYDNQYREELRERHREEQERKGAKLQEGMPEQETAYAKDACGLGCSDHEGIQVRGIPGTSLVAVVYKARMDDDVLKLQLRFYNDGEVPERLVIDPSIAPASFYVEVGEAKLGILKDEDGEFQAKEPLDEVLEPGEIVSWWAEFPAPPSGTASFNLDIFPVDPFLNVPLHAD